MSMSAVVGEFFGQHLIDPVICIRCNTCEAACPVHAITHDVWIVLAPEDGLFAAAPRIPPMRSGPPPRNASASNWAYGPVVELACCLSAVRIGADESDHGRRH